MPTGNAAAQDTPAPPKTAAPHAATEAPGPAAKSSNVRSGEISVIDAAADTVTLRERAGKTGLYSLTPKSHYTRNRHAAQLADFKAGDAVVLHFRRSRSDGALLVTELDDSASWMWLSGLRKNTTAAVVRLITEDTLSVVLGTDKLAFDYTVSDKTRWAKGGKEADAAAFKVGDHVFVVPRSLPSGAVMARAVSDSMTGAAQEKERLAPSVHGAVVSADLSAHKLVLKTLAGDTRSLAFSDETEVVSGGKPAPLTILRPGLRVVARVRHEAGGDETVWRVTVETSRKLPSVKKRPPAGKGAVTVH